MNWLSNICDRWREAQARDRLPHAVLIAGPPGVGKRALAAWMASGKLSGQLADRPSFPVPEIEHADFHRVSIPDEKSNIGVDQIRSLIGEFSLTSYVGRGKVAIIEPAQKMTGAAANALLKTLEEPAGDALIILIADRAGRLPATIFSRCQTVPVGTPTEEDALAFLEALSPGRDWLEALASAHGAPMTAAETVERLGEIRDMRESLDGILVGRLDPIPVAAQWSKLDPPFVLDWLASEIQSAVKATVCGEKWAPGLGLDTNRLAHIDRRKLFCYLDIINRLRASAKGSFNVQVAFERLLIDLADGLKRLDWTFTPRGLDYVRAAENRA